MTVWAVSLVGIILLTALTDVILPDGETNKYIKTVLSVIVVLVIVAPLPKLFGGDFSWEDFLPNKEYSVQDSYLDSVKQQKVTYEEIRSEEFLAVNGYEKADVFVTTDNTDPAKFKIKSVSVNLKNSVIQSDKQNINIVEDIVKLLSRFLNVDSSAVTVYGKN